MRLPRPAKVLLAFSLAVGVLVYVVLVDLGINAGRIHYGVTVDGFEVGGLTEIEAIRALATRGGELRDTPVVITTEGLNCNFVPGQLGWGPQPSDTAGLARGVGRDGGPFEAVGQRLRAWFEGVEVEWAGKPRRKKMNALLDECERQAEGLGLLINRWKLRKRVRQAIVTWPRRPFDIPVMEG